MLLLMLSKRDQANLLLSMVNILRLTQRASNCRRTICKRKKKLRAGFHCNKELADVHVVRQLLSESSARTPWRLIQLINLKNCIPMPNCIPMHPGRDQVVDSTHRLKHDGLRETHRLGHDVLREARQARLTDKWKNDGLLCFPTTRPPAPSICSIATNDFWPLLRTWNSKINKPESSLLHSAFSRN